MTDITTRPRLDLELRRRPPRLGLTAIYDARRSFLARISARVDSGFET